MVSHPIVMTETTHLTLLRPSAVENSGSRICNGGVAADVDVLQSYENFTGGVLMSLVEHGFCEPDECNEFFVDARPFVVIPSLKKLLK